MILGILARALADRPMAPIAPGACWTVFGPATCRPDPLRESFLLPGPIEHLCRQPRDIPHVCVCVRCEDPPC